MMFDEKVLERKYIERERGAIRYFDDDLKALERASELVEEKRKELQYLEKLLNSGVPNKRKIQKSCVRIIECINEKKEFNFRESEIDDKIIKTLFKKNEGFIQQQLREALDQNLANLKNQRRIYSQFLGQNRYKPQLGNIYKKRLEPSDIKAIRSTIKLLKIAIDNEPACNSSLKSKVIFLKKSTLKAIDFSRKEMSRIYKFESMKNEILNPEDKKEFLGSIETLSAEIKKKEELAEKIREMLNEQRVIRSRTNPKQLIAIRMTDVFPKGGIMKTSHHRFHLGLFKNPVGDIPRETVHFTLNGVVTGHMQGNWDGSRFAILIPFEKIKDRITYLRGEDSWVIGDLVLPPGSEILMNGTQLYKRKAGYADVIYIDNERLTEAVEKRIRERGYTLLKIQEDQSIIAGEEFKKMIWSLQEEFNKNSFEAGRIVMSFGDLEKELSAKTYSHANSVFGGISRTNLHQIEASFNYIDDFLKKGIGTRNERLEIIIKLKALLDKLNKEREEFSKAEGKEAKEEQEAYARLINHFDKIIKFFKELNKEAV